MMNKRESLYNLGNDYPQTTSAYFEVDDKDVAEKLGVPGYKAYSDGLYHCTVKPAYELSGGEGALNKRIFNVPQTAWAPVSDDIMKAYSGMETRTAVLSDDYATGVVVGDEGMDKGWKKPE